MNGFDSVRAHCAARTRVCSFAAVALALSLSTPFGAVWAESNLVLPYPHDIGSYPAATYDDDGKRLGGASLSLVELDDGTVQISVHTGVEGGANTRAQAILEVLDDKTGLRLLSEQSESQDETGRPLGRLFIDHQKAVGSCTPPPHVGGEPITHTLPADERVANVPLNLLFLPLVQGGVEQIDFQYFLCRGGARVMDFRAKRDGAPVERDGKQIIRVTYGPYLGDTIGWIAGNLIPKLEFWFTAANDGSYLAHRMPLFSKGPEVVVVRDGMLPSLLP
jgi:hypothetical protein